MMMKAAVLTSPTQPLEIKEVPIPQVGPNEVLVKNITCGVCHSDLHLARKVVGDGAHLLPLPLILGHEGVGEVVQLGSNVGEKVKLGDVIGIPWIQKTCLNCEYCVSGREPLCIHQKNSGFSSNGCYAEYSLIDADFAVKLPQGMDPYTSAPLFCAGVTTYKALKVSQARTGQWVSIIGIGGLGSLAIAYGVAMGLRMMAVVAPNDKTAFKLAKDMGAEEVYDGPADQHSEWVKTKTEGGVQAAIITVPLIQAYDEGFKSIKRGGRLVAVGIPTDSLTIPILAWIASGIELVSSITGTRQDLKEALQLAQLHKITCKIQKRKLEEINEIFDAMSNYQISGRVVLDFSAK